jgi:hypothetical protein
VTMARSVSRPVVAKQYSSRKLLMQSPAVIDHHQNFDGAQMHSGGPGHQSNLASVTQAGTFWRTVLTAAAASSMQCALLRAAGAEHDEARAAHDLLNVQLHKRMHVVPYTCTRLMGCRLHPSR